jgi:hypothetical protein
VVGCGDEPFGGDRSVLGSEVTTPGARAVTVEDATMVVGDVQTMLAAHPNLPPAGQGRHRGHGEGGGCCR